MPSKFPSMQFAILDYLEREGEHPGADIAAALGIEDYPRRAGVEMALIALKRKKLVTTRVPDVGTREEMWHYAINEQGREMRGEWERAWCQPKKKKHAH